MLSTDEILKFITNDNASELKQNARKGLSYYEGIHDIKDYKLYYYNDEGKLVEDKTRSNIKISHPFFTELVDQEVQYMLSGSDRFICSDTPELQSELDDYFNFNEDFIAELSDTMTGAIAKGWEFMFAYRNSENRLSFQCGDSLGVIEVDPKHSSDGKPYVIYWYIERLDVNSQPVKRVQVWTDESTYCYTQGEDGKLTLDKSTNEKPNPIPHTLYKKDNDDNTYFEGFGFIPFFRLDNNRKRISGLNPIKDIIDDYDLMSCGLSNNLQDASEYLVVVKGFQGNDMEELMQNIRTKKHIGVSGDNGGDVEFKTVDIPYEARKIKLELDDHNIYRYGMGFNSQQIGDGNITNIVIKSRYTLLELKAFKFEKKLTQFLRKIIKVVLDEINKEKNTAFTQSDVYFDLNREVMANASDNAQIELIDAQRKQTEINTYLALQDALGDEIVIEKICSILDIDYDEIKDKLPQNEDPNQLINQLIQEPLEE